MTTVKELQSELKKRGLDSKGRKAELQARLDEDDAAKVAPDDDIKRCDAPSVAATSSAAPAAASASPSLDDDDDDDDTPVYDAFGRLKRGGGGKGGGKRAGRSRSRSRSADSRSRSRSRSRGRERSASPFAATSDGWGPRGANLFVTGFPKMWTRDKESWARGKLVLRQVFGAFGKVASIRVGIVKRSFQGPRMSVRL